MAIGKKTEPKYAIRLANKASSKVLDIERAKYPILTTKTDENNKTNQNSFLFITPQYTTNKSKETTVITPYTTDMLVDLEPTVAQPVKEKDIPINKNININLEVFSCSFSLTYSISYVNHTLNYQTNALTHLSLSYYINFIKNRIFSKSIPLFVLIMCSVASHICYRIIFSFCTRHKLYRNP